MIHRLFPLNYLFLFFWLGKRVVRRDGSGQAAGRRSGYLDLTLTGYLGLPRTLGQPTRPSPPLDLTHAHAGQTRLGQL